MKKTIKGLKKMNRNSLKLKNFNINNKDYKDLGKTIMLLILLKKLIYYWKIKEKREKQEISKG